jgi:hypothetical protein
MTSALAWYGNGADVQVHRIFCINIGASEQSAQWHCVHGQKVLMPLQFAFSVLEVLGSLLEIYQITFVF